MEEISKRFTFVKKVPIKEEKRIVLFSENECTVKRSNMCPTTNQNCPDEEE